LGVEWILWNVFRGGRPLSSISDSVELKEFSLHSNSNCDAESLIDPTAMVEFASTIDTSSGISERLSKRLVGE
jgi:hypothetical protein